jgi:asparagine synthase (glutamine-hydrolysing)
LASTRETLFTPELWQQIGDYTAYDDLPIERQRMARWSPLNQSLYVSYKTMLPGLLLRAKGDRSAMNASVETRPPFLDEDVIQFCSQLATEYKLRGFREKWLLRKMAARHLPPHIAWRRKFAFRGAMAPTFLGPERPAWVDELLSPESIAATGYFNFETIARHRAELNAYHSGKRGDVGQRLHCAAYDLGITCAVTTQLWHHLFCGGGLCSLPTWTAKPVSDSAGI